MEGRWEAEQGGCEARRGGSQEGAHECFACCVPLMHDELPRSNMRGVHCDRPRPLQAEQIAKKAEAKKLLEEEEASMSKKKSPAPKVWGQRVTNCGILHQTL